MISAMARIPDIYAQRYNSIGTPLGSNFKVNDDVGTTMQAVPAIAMDFLGNFVITWDDYRNGSNNPDIYCQRYNSGGTPLETNFKINDDVGSFYQLHSAVAMDSSGNFIITWDDGRSGSNEDIYAQRYNSSGATLGTNFQVNDDLGTAGQVTPKIAINSSGSFVIVWEDRRLSSYGDIYAQRYNFAGTALGSNFKVNDDAGTVQQNYPAIVMDALGNFIITWQDNRNPYMGWDVYAQRYDSAGAPLDNNFKVNDDAVNAVEWLPAIASDGLGNFVITWGDTRRGNYNYDIFAQRYSSSGTTLGTNFLVNDEVETANQLVPAAAISVSGNSVVTWVDSRQGPSDPAIYAQRYNSSGTPSGSNFRVDEVIGRYHDNPAIAMDGSGNFVIAWEDYRDGTWDIYAQRYNASGNLLGSNFKVNEDFGTFQDQFPAVAMDGSGNFVITWVRDSLSEVSPIYAQRYNSSGTPLGSNFRVNDLDMYSIEPPTIAMNSSGNFIISWQDWFVYAQRYDSSGTPLGSNFQVNDAGQCFRSAIAMDSLGNSVITWEDDRGTHSDIYAQRYDSSGTPLDSNFKVNDDIGITYNWSPHVSMMCGNRFVITWQDDRNGTDGDIYAQNFAWNGLRLGNNYLVTDPLYESYQQDHPVVTANDSKVCFIWQDKREGTWDIYAKLFDCSSLFPSTPYPLTFVSWGPVHLIIIDPAGDSIGLGFNTIGNGSSYFTATNFDSVSIPNALIGNYQIRVTFAGLFKAPATYSLGIRINGNEMTLLKNNENTPPPEQSDDVSYNVLAYLIGNANKDNITDIGDIVYLINYVFYGGEEPVPIKLGNANCDEIVDIGDIVYLINYVFYGGNPPCS
jgi:hypothetical protein